MDIHARYATFAADMEVPSAFLNNLQDRDIDIVAKAWVDPAFLALCTSGSKTLSFTYNADDTVATISAGTGAVSAAYSYDAVGRVDTIVLTHDTVTREVAFAYDASGNISTATVTTP